MVKSTPSKTKLCELTVLAIKLLTQTSFHDLPPVFGLVPRLYVLFRSGTMLDATSAANTTLSVSASPSVILPSAVMFPVA